MTTIQNGKKELKELIRTTGYKMIEDVEETSRKRIIGTISQRLEDAFNVLDAAEAYTAEEAAAEGRKPLKETVIQILLHPAVTLVLTVSAMAFGILSISLGGPVPQVNTAWAVRMILVLAVLLAQGIFSLVLRAGKKEAPKETPPAQPGIDLMKAKVTATKLAGTMLGDSKAIAELFTEEKRRAGNDFESEVVKLYCSLFETRLDNPDVGDLSYGVTLAEMLLRKMGIRSVSYTPENEKLFEIQYEDYHDEMRAPALVREKTGELVRKGEYIRNIHRK